MARVACVGSLNYDITVWVDRRPEPDETLHGTAVAEFRGGKGANQVVAAARLGAEATMIGCVGGDARADFLLEGLDLDGVDRTGVIRVAEPTGVAVITIDPTDVSIIVVAGANTLLSPALVDDNAESIVAADVLLLQGEIPAEAAGRAAEIARSAGTTIVFNPAPFNDVVPVVVPLADVVIVNRQERAQLGDTEVELLITTLGPDGCEVTEGEKTVSVAPFRADVVDPTGAGDCFAAAFAVALAEGRTPTDAARFANAAGSLAVATAGAQPSFPTRPQLHPLLSP